jgi:c-di-GMP-binding flagellar brake protein YcgR
MPGSAVEKQQYRKTLGQACARNQPIEVQFDTIDGHAKTAKSRLLQMDETYLMIDRPTIKGGLAQIPDKSTITVSYNSGGDRYRFRSRVGTIRSVQLNEKTNIKSLEILIPETVERSQRRRDFRISLAGSGTLEGTLEPLNWQTESAGDDPDENVTGADESRIQSSKISVRLANISAGGVGVVMDHTHAHLVRAGEHHSIEFWLPGDDDAFQVRVEIRHVINRSATANTVVGLKFIEDPASGSFRAAIQRVSRFVAEEQRRQLRNRRQVQ